MRHRARRDAAIGEILLDMMPGSSGRTRKQLLENRRVQVRGRVVARANHAVKAGDEVEITPAALPDDLPPSLRILHEDEGVVVARKAPGLLTIATPTERERTAYAYLSAHVKRRRPSAKIFIVHRLDKLASGLLVFAKSPEIKAALQAQFEAHTVERTYAAVVEGKVKRETGTLESRIEEVLPSRVRETRDETRGRHAVTHFRVVETRSLYSLLELRLETGRKNQIRVQLAGIGHPIVGDEAYGSRIDPLGRLALHARTLGFEHPLTEERLLFDDPVPPEFIRLLRADPGAQKGRS